jgi:hypothetical protein
VGTTTYEKFLPPAIYRDHLGNATLVQISDEVASADLERLRALNGFWFAQPMGFLLAVAVVWVVNRRLTELGVAPAWRNAPEFVTGRFPSAAPPGYRGPRLLTDGQKRGLLRRWVDWEWLRCRLGPDHKTKLKKWKDAFSDETRAAESAWARVNAVMARGGGKGGPITPYLVVDALSVPRIYRLGLCGLVDRDRGELRTNARKRVDIKIRPKLEALMHRARYPLTEPQLRQRLIVCEAIELAKGKPTDAALIYGWITGELISRQTMFAHRRKIAEQCKLTTLAWT